MPPKGSKKKASAVAKTPTTSTPADVPSVVVSKRGTEYDTTAASTRPRRATVTAPVQATANTSAPATKKRGRSAKTTEEVAEPPKKRGRPAKNAAVDEESDLEKEPTEAPKKRGRPAKVTADAVEPPKKRGRPAKAVVVEDQSDVEEEPAEAPKDSTTAAPKKRGGAAKAVQTDPEPAVDEEGGVEDTDNNAAEAEPAKKGGRQGKKAGSESAPVTEQPAKKRGRPARVSKEPAEAPEAPDTPAPRKRHSGRTGGPTTKIASDANDAAEQLEEELVDEVSKSAKTGDKRKASSASLSGGGGKNYWLMKAEQVDRMETLKDGSEFNTKFTIDDLKAKDGPEPWEGVRNAVARNNMRAMKLGDLAFFYASQGKHPGITGIVEIVKEHEPDFTVTDESSIGFVEPSKRGKENQWSLVHVEFRKKLREPVTLKQLQKFSSDKGVLKDMQVIKQSRLSVAKVTEKEWNFITDNLIEGFESEDDEDFDDGVDEAKPMSGMNGDDQATEGAEAVDGDDLVDVEGDKVEEPEIGLPLDNIGLPTLTNANVDDFPTSGTEIPPTTHATSRPTSRQVSNGSRPVSRAGSRSRQGSIAPLPVLQTTEETFTSHVITQSVTEPARPGSHGSRAGSLKPTARGSSREPSARPTSRGRDKSPNAALMPSLRESMSDG